MSKDCRYCDGSGERYVVVPHRSGRNKLATERCICIKSHFVSKCKDFLTLEWLGDDYLPPEKIDKSLIFNPNDLSESPNYIFYDPDYYDFCLHMKSVIIRYRFLDNPIPMYCGSSINVLHRFYVKQNDGSSPRLVDTDMYDLIIITLDNKEKNDPLKTCIAQIVYHRLRIRKPTWLYIPHASFTEENKEYSDELLGYMNSTEIDRNDEKKAEKRRFIKKKILPTGEQLKTQVSQSQQSAAGFRL